MVKHELAEKAIKFKAKDDPSGTRNLLRLHRALEFIVMFMESLGKLEDEEKCVGVAHEAYKVRVSVTLTSATYSEDLAEAQAELYRGSLNQRLFNPNLVRQ